MKFSTASSVAVLSAAIPAFVSAADINVMVGANQAGEPGLVFDPQVVTAAVGDIVHFQFRGGNHTVTQSSFANPCAWQFNTVANANGFNSGFVPFDAASGSVGVYSLEITQTATPIWYFCGRPPHCKGGMFGAINPPASGNTFDAFTANVQTTEEPGLGVTVPFTPGGGAAPPADPSAPVSPPAGDDTAAPNTPPTGGVAPPAGPSQSDVSAPPAETPESAAGMVGPRSAIVLGFLGLAASFVL